MKKLSVLIALALCLTITGAYAAWSFAGNTNISAESSSTISMAEVTETTPVGTYTITNNLTFTVDNGGDYKTALVTEGNLVITFTPSAQAPDAIKTGALNTTLTIEVEGQTNKHNGTVLLEVTTANLTIKDSGDYQWTDNGNGTFSVTIAAADIADCLNLAEIQLINKDAFTAYKAVLDLYTIKFTVNAD